MIIAQQPAQSLAALHGPLSADICIARKQQDVVHTLVIAFGMIMFDVFAQRSPQRALSNEDQLGQALVLHRSDPALRIFRFGRAGSAIGST